MKKTALAITMVTVAIMILVSVSFNVKTIKAQNAGNYTITHVNHEIEVLYNGYIFINDTMQMTGQASDGFLMGFPYKYGSYILRCVAYNSSDIFRVTLNIPLENRVGFYGVEIDFSQGTPQVFTVGFILSNNLLTQDASNTSLYTLDFPAYPSLTKAVAVCNVSISLPEGTTYISGTVNASNYSEENLPEFTYSPANITFSLTGDKMQMFDVKELESEVRISGIGEVEGSDSYYIESKSLTDISSIEIILPPNASASSVQDQFGRTMSQPELTDEKTNRYKITFASALESYRSTRFTVKYKLPSNYTTQMGTNNFNITFPLFRHVNYYIEWASVTFVLPEGARISSFETTLIGSAYNIARGVFQETVTMNRGNISLLEDGLASENVLQIVYEYNPLWLSFRPTLWMWALAIVGCTVAIVWKRPEAPAGVAVPIVGMRLRPEYIKSFIDAHEEKKKIIFDIESLENRVRKGKIPRRRYKVQRKTLETRLSTLSRNLTEFKEKMRAAGGQYVELMQQLEIAETEINEVEANIKSIESRHSRGELSLEAHRKLLSDYQRRKERADTTINGILLRLREEIH
ncbi:MAG: hypothetical protein WAN82_00215 [Candidatus Bathyarchaeia archaeon]